MNSCVASNHYNWIILHGALVGIEPMMPILSKRRFRALFSMTHLSVVWQFTTNLSGQKGKAQ